MSAKEQLEVMEKALLEGSDQEQEDTAPEAEEDAGDDVDQRQPREQESAQEHRPSEMEVEPEPRVASAPAEAATQAAVEAARMIGVRMGKRGREQPHAEDGELPDPEGRQSPVRKRQVAEPDAGVEVDDEVDELIKELQSEITNLRQKLRQ